MIDRAMRSLVLFLLLSGCGGDDGGTPPGKTEVTCGATWDRTPPIAGTCDSACAEMVVGTGAPCGTGIQYSGGEIVCSSTFEIEGERGCCFDLEMEGSITSPNEPKRTRRVFFLSCK